MAQPINRPAVGAPAPDLEMVDLDGEIWRLSERVGHAVVLIFHRHIH